MPTIREYITALTSVFEDPVGTARPLWRDYSRYQMLVNFDVARICGVCGTALRSTISWSYVDAFFDANYKAAAGKMYRTSYHVIYPSQDVVKQADNWYRVHPTIDVIPRVIDLELSTDMLPKPIADATWKLSEIVKSRDGVRPIIYTRYRLIEEWLNSWTATMLNEHYWWLAEYMLLRSVEHAGPPTLPKRPSTGLPMINRNNVIMHQTADKKAPFKGELYNPLASQSVDWDRWELGNELQMHQWIQTVWGGTAPPPMPTPPASSAVDPLYKAQITASALNVRAEPSASSTDLGDLSVGNIVPVVEETDAWARIDGWISKTYIRKV